MSRSRSFQLSAPLLLEGYRRGLFPMALDDGEIGWFSPDPRGIIPLGRDEFHLPHGLKRRLKHNPFVLRIDSQFEAVMRACAQRKETWISEEIVRSYLDLHLLGHAHSVECWQEGELVGGLYGVALQGVFFGESMFHTVTDASKVALVRLVETLRLRVSRCSIFSGPRRISRRSARRISPAPNTCGGSRWRCNWNAVFSDAAMGWITRLAWLVMLCALASVAKGQTALAPDKLFFDTVAVPGAAYRVARCEVIQAQYQEITGDNPSQFPDPKAPVDSVSWEDAKAFCARLTEREHAAGRLPMDWTYDLPTDAQWDEFAAGTEVMGAVTSLEGAREHTEPVGKGKSNPLGLHDVVGNVWEWCLDWYDNRIRKKDANPDVPYIMSDAEAAARGPEETYKVLRGGAWDTGPSDGFKLASRLRYAPSMANRRTGFRCVVIRKP